MTDWLPYEQLPEVGDTGERHAWDVFGRDDELGALNFIDEVAVRRGAGCVQSGLVFNLDLPVDQPQPQFWAPGRGAPAHHEEVRRQGRDDYLERFYLQGTTQWDGLRHYRFREYGYFGGRDDEALDGRGELGINSFAEHGIITRGLLLDVEGYCARVGIPVDYESRLAVDADMLAAMCDHVGAQPEPGDVLILRTGWLRWYQGLDLAARNAAADLFVRDRASLALPGLDASKTTIAWLWDHRIAGVAADNPTMEALPYLPELGWAHRRLLALLGIPIGELWNVHALFEACAESGRFAFLLTSSPLNVPQGTGTPANAYAVL